MSADQAFVTMATTHSYCMGALVVGQCLRRHGTTRQTVVMVSPNVSSQARDALGHVFDQVLVVDVLDSGDRAHLCWLRRPELGITFTKFHCWTLTQYSKCVFLDADTLVLCNVDELFEREELSAAPDPGWPDCFNSGVFVFRPSLDTYARLLEHARQYGSFDGGDQGLLNTFFSDWAVRDIRKHLPFVYNLSANAIYTYLPAYQEYGHNAKIVHFLGSVKPWNLRSNSQIDQPFNVHLEEFVYQWWSEYSYLLLLTKTKWPQEPARLTQPAVPMQPAVPVKTSDLVQPSYPVQPFDPVQHSKPVQPAVPVRPSDPVQPFVPIQPLQQSQEQREQPEAMEDTVLFIEDLAEPLLSEATLFTERPGPPTQPREKSVQPEDGFPWDKRGARGSTSHQDPPGSSEEGSELTEMAYNIVADHETEPTGPAGHDPDGRRQWERGHVDYLGKDAFDNIQKKLDRFLNS